MIFEEQRLRRIEYSFGCTGVSLAELEKMGREYTKLNEESWLVFPEWKPFLERSPSRQSLVTNGSSEQQRKKLSVLGLENRSLIEVASVAAAVRELEKLEGEHNESR